MSRKNLSGRKSRRKRSSRKKRFTRRPRVQVGGAEEQEQELRAELGRMKLSGVKKRAKEAGVSEDELEVADDEDDIKAAVIELILEKQKDLEGRKDVETAVESPEESEQAQEDIDPLEAPSEDEGWVEHLKGQWIARETTNRKDLVDEEIFRLEKISGDGNVRDLEGSFSEGDFENGKLELNDLFRFRI